MRIVGGQLKGRTLVAPKHEGLRPTSDRVRESVFNIISHGIPGDEGHASPMLEGARVIDLFAGTGALGLEAISRGAAYCLFVESDSNARALVRRNVEAFGLTGVTRIFRRDACDLGAVATMAPFDIAFADPPYGKGLGGKALAALAGGGWLKPGALIVLEERATEAISAPTGYRLVDKRTWGETEVHFFIWRAGESAEGA
ncbi:MAG: 16S rRNA (guanine(966)-N(2))-methyltransferase RsmD [Hyphomicrobiaceae bacterium]|nr:16S rRNA (guanine(966)-N(2))-methyltransferase RsmD [Hyphomicrobiaceae bacterium]